jgi:hypothetical protein
LIGGWSFEKCTGLSAIDIPDSVTDIDLYSFTGSGLRSLVFGPGVTLVSGGVAMDCLSLEHVEFLGAVRLIEGEAFRNCSSLAAIELPETVAAVYEGAFKASAIRHLHLPSLVPLISRELVYGCSRLETFTYGGVIQKIEMNVFQGCLLLSEFILRDGVETIGEAAFRESGLTSVRLPNASLKLLSAGAFSQCQSLASVAFRFLPPPGSASWEWDETAFEGDSVAELLFEEEVREVAFGARPLDAMSGSVRALEFWNSNVVVRGGDRLIVLEVVRLRTCAVANASFCEWLGNATLEIPLGVRVPSCVKSWRENESLGDCRGTPGMTQPTASRPKSGTSAGTISAAPSPTGRESLGPPTVGASMTATSSGTNSAEFASTLGESPFPTVGASLSATPRCTGSSGLATTLGESLIPSVRATLSGTGSGTASAWPRSTNMGSPVPTRASGGLTSMGIGLICGGAAVLMAVVVILVFRRVRGCGRRGQLGIGGGAAYDRLGSAASPRSCRGNDGDCRANE